MKHFVFCIFSALFTCIASELDVPFVPTPYEIVNGMLEIANVNSADTLYDLGCGDGRIVITAVSKRGIKKGVGVDMDPQRIKECHSNALKAGINRKVTFVTGNLFEIDFSEATVLTLYLLPDVNLKLRSKIIKSLRPGSRVVSHDFDMGTWNADKEKNIANSTIYLWVVPANISGTWNWYLQDKDTSHFLMNINQVFQQISATAIVNKVNNVSIINTNLNGQHFSTTFRFNSSKGDKREITFSGVVSKNQISGVYITSKSKNKPWSAIRESSTIQDIAPDQL